MTVRAAVIGLGAKGWSGAPDLYPTELTHVGAVDAVDDLDLIAVCDIKEELRDRFTEERCDVSIYEDYEVMMSNEELDVVSIVTPTWTHMPIARNVVRFETVKAVMLEKPVAVTIPDAEKVLRTYKDTFKIPCVVNYTRRWHPAWKYARKKILEFGHCHTIVGYCNGEPLEAGTHMTDLFNMLAPKADPWYIDLYQEHSHGGPYQPYLVFDVHAFCPLGRVCVVDNGVNVIVERVTSSTVYRDLNELCASPEDDSYWPYNQANIQAQLAAFAELRDLALGKRQKPTCGLGHGVRAMKLLEEEFI